MARKKYSINWENDEPISFEVDGVSYESLDQVPDETDREKLSAMMDGSLDQQLEKDCAGHQQERGRQPAGDQRAHLRLLHIGTAEIAMHKPRHIAHILLGHRSVQPELVTDVLDRRGAGASSGDHAQIAPPG